MSNLLLEVYFESIIKCSIPINMTGLYLILSVGSFSFDENLSHEYACYAMFPHLFDEGSNRNMEGIISMEEQFCCAFCLLCSCLNLCLPSQTWKICIKILVRSTNLKIATNLYFCFSRIVTQWFVVCFVVCSFYSLSHSLSKKDRDTLFSFLSIKKTLFLDQIFTLICEST